MPKPPFVAKENVERFIFSFVHENKKLPTMAEIRNHFGGGSMNRYSEILKGMNISAPEKKSPLTLDPLETSQLMAGIIPFFEQKMARLVKERTENDRDLRLASVDALAEMQKKYEELEEASREKELRFTVTLKDQESRFISELKSLTQTAAEEKVQLQAEIQVLREKLQQERERITSVVSENQKAARFFSTLEEFAGKKLEDKDLIKLRNYLARQESSGRYYSRVFS